MPEVTTYAEGTPSWVDLGTSDPAGARAFYGGLFGWEFDEGQAEFSNYTNARLRGQRVAGIGGEPAPEGMPTAWTTYLATADAGATAERVTANGGAVMFGPHPVGDQGSFLVAGDPTGAVFGSWQAGTHIGSALVNEPGTIVWNELTTRDLEAGKAFYSAVFDVGWQPIGEDLSPGVTYETFTVAGTTVGGGLQMDERFPAEIPAHWMAYFGVEDCDAAAAEVERLGGAISVPPFDTPFGRQSVVRDPQGGVFTIMNVATPD